MTKKEIFEEENRRRFPGQRPWPTVDECRQDPPKMVLAFTSTWLAVTAKGVRYNVYTCTYMYIHVYVYMYVYVYTYTYVYVHVYVHTCVCVCHVHTGVYCVYVCMYVDFSYTKVRTYTTYILEPQKLS